MSSHWLFHQRMVQAIADFDFAAAKRYRKLGWTEEGIFLPWPWSFSSTLKGKPEK